MRTSLLAGSLALLMVGAQARAGQQDLAQQAIPDAPKPQTNLPVNGVTPGQGTTSSSNDGTTPEGTPDASTTSAPSSAEAPAAQAPSTPAAEQGSSIEPPEGKGLEELQTLRVSVNEVDIAFTVKDNKGKLVAGLRPRDIQVFENGVMMHPVLFTNEAQPLSVALVIDQSMTKDEMDRVNEALGALPDAFSKYDEVAVFTYNKSVKEITDYTGSQSARLTQAIDESKSSGRDTMMAGSLSGPLANTTIVNNQNFDPNTAAVRGHSSIALMQTRESHPLNDAILEAAKSLSTKPTDRRRVIYVISNGNEYGSSAKTSQVVKYLLTNNIEVDGTLVGETALWGLGTLDHMHLPWMIQDNVLVKYQKATGGQIDSEFRTASIEKSFARVASEARNRYTVAYLSPEPFVDEKYRHVEVRVLHPGLTVLARDGYWPAAMAMRQQPRRAATPKQ